MVGLRLAFGAGLLGPWGSIYLHLGFGAGTHFSRFHEAEELP